MKRWGLGLWAFVLILPGIEMIAFAAGGDMGGSFQDGSVDNPFLIEDKIDFDKFACDPNYWDDCIRLEIDIDLSDRNYSAAIISLDVNNFNPGFDGAAFRGIFDGNGYVIRNINIETSDANSCYIGLFGKMEGTDSEIKNLGLENINIAGVGGAQIIGGICGENSMGKISNCYVRGMVNSGDGSRLLGGVCGNNHFGEIINSYFIGDVRGMSILGGICGNNYQGRIVKCYAVSSIVGRDGSINLGGLCGSNYGSEISSCYTIGEVIGGNNAGPIGGLCGRNNYIIIQTAGIVGDNGGAGIQFAQFYNSTITNCYSMSRVAGGDSSGPIGGLCGSNSGKIINSYSTGLLTAGGDSDYVGGFCGHSYGVIENCYWDVETCGIGIEGDSNYGATGKRTLQMQTENTFISTNWDLTDTWWINNERNYPKLSYQLSADLNNDGLVNFYDFAIMARSWESLNTDTNYNSICDISGDDMIDETDLAILSEWWLERIIF